MLLSQLFKLNKSFTRHVYLKNFTYFGEYIMFWRI